MTHRLTQPRGARRAMTLIEIMITTGLMVVVLGIALGIAGETEKASRRIAQAQAGLQYAQLAMENATSSVRAAIDPRQLEGLQNQTVLTPNFAEHELTLFTFEQGVLSKVTLKQQQASGKPQELVREVRALAEAAGSAAAAAEERKLGGPDENGFKPSINFGFAKATAPGVQPQFSDSWTEPGLPEIVQVVVHVRFDDERNRELKLQTVVMPGWVRTPQATAAVIGVPTPEELPAPTPEAIAPVPTATPAAPAPTLADPATDTLTTTAPLAPAPAPAAPPADAATTATTATQEAAQ